MIVKKLGKVSQGKKYIGLETKLSTDFGYTIRCTGETRIYTFNNVNQFEWFKEGREVYMASFHHYYDVQPYDLGMWSKVEITEAKSIKPYLLDIEKLK